MYLTESVESQWGFRVVFLIKQYLFSGSPVALWYNLPNVFLSLNLFNICVVLFYYTWPVLLASELSNGVLFGFINLEQKLMET